MQDEDGFALVVRKRRRHKKGSRRAANDKHTTSDNRSRRNPGGATDTEAEENETIYDEVTDPAEYVRSTLEPLREKIRERPIFKNTMDYCKAFLEQMPASYQPVQFVALGIGHFTRSRGPCLQLALLMELLESLRHDTDKDPLIREVDCTCVDPAFGETELAVLQELGLGNCSSEDEIGYSTSLPTILYMPHCPVFLYGKLIEAYSLQCDQSEGIRASLSPFMMLGNSLLMYLRSEERIPRNRLPSGNQEFLALADRINLSSENVVDSLEELLKASTSCIESDRRIQFTCERLSGEDMHLSGEEVAFNDLCCHYFIAMGRDSQ